MTRKEQKEEKRRAILMTALELFVKNGYHDTKITDIAKAVPMSTGLMFHYFESKEVLLLELVKTGAGATASTDKLKELPPDMYFTMFLKSLFEYSKEQPWVFNMFVLMGRARRSDMPEDVRKVAKSVSAVEASAEVIRKGQEQGVFKKGDPLQLSLCFWAAVQGIMEEMAMDPTVKAPEPEWLVDMIKA